MSTGDTGLAGGAARHDRINAVNSKGASGWSPLASATTANSIPGRPALIASPLPRAVYLSWASPATPTGGLSITRCEVQKWDSANRRWVDLRSTSATNTTDSGLENGKRYFYRVRAVNSMGDGPWSTLRSAVPAVPSGNESQRSSGLSLTGLGGQKRDGSQPGPIPNRQKNDRRRGPHRQKRRSFRSPPLSSPLPLPPAVPLPFPLPSPCPSPCRPPALPPAVPLPFPLPSPCPSPLQSSSPSKNPKILVKNPGQKSKNPSPPCLSVEKRILSTLLQDRRSREKGWGQQQGAGLGLELSIVKMLRLE